MNRTSLCTPRSMFRRQDKLAIARNSLLSSLLPTVYCICQSSIKRNMSQKTAAVFLAEGSEEIEFVVSVDVLRRAGVKVTVVGLHGNKPVKCSRDVVISPEISLSEVAKQGPYDAFVLPGGLGGSKNFASSKELGTILKEQYDAGRIVAAICAAPTALKAHGIGHGKLVTSYPSTKNEMVADGKYRYSEDKVVVDGNLITSRGPGTTFDFALAISEKLRGKSETEPVAKAMLLA